MYTRNRESTHHYRCFKFRAYWKDHENDRRLPDPVYAFADKQRNLWNDLATEQERRWKEWQAAHPGVKSVGKDGAEQVKFEKPPREWWDNWTAFAKTKASESGLGWDSSEDILKRVDACLKRLSKGGGAPKPRRGWVKRFSIRHRYGNSGLPVPSLQNKRQERFRILFPVDDRITSAWVRVGNEKIGLNVVMHRPLPLFDTFVKQVRLTGWKQSPTLPWVIHVVFTIEEMIPVEPPTTGKKIGIDVGWRKLDDDRLRVAVSYDGSVHEDVVLPLKFVSNRLGEVSLDRIRGCQKMKDSLLELCKKNVAAALGESLPQGFVQMRNGGLIRLLHGLRESNANSPAIPVLEKWLQDNDRLQAKILLLQNAMTGRRKHIFQERAARWVKEFDVIRIENIDLPDMYDKEQTKEEYALEASAERRKYASCGELIQAIKNAASFSGKRVELVEAAHTTDVCCKCGAMFEAGSKLEGRCEAGHVMDQDWNAAVNIFANQPPVAAKASVA